MHEQEIHNIPFDSFKNYISSIKSVRVKGNAYEIEGKYGILSFDFSKFKNVTKCVLGFRRSSGNGLVLISSGPHNQTIQVKSKIKEEFSIPLVNGKLDIKRPFRSRGPIELTSINLYGNVTEVNWNDVLRKCQEYTCLRLVDNKLIASEGATIFADRISDVETQPPNMFSATGNRVVFLGSCQITNLNVEGHPKESIKIPHMKEEPPVVAQEPIEADRLVPVHTKRTMGKGRLGDGGSTRLLFDSAVTGFNRANCHGDAKYHSTHVVLDLNGNMVIPAKFLQGNETYVVVVEASKISGNGKFSISISPNSDVKNFIAIGHKKAFSVTMNSGPSADNSFDIVIGRSQSAKGLVSIYRVMVLLDYYKVQYQQPRGFFEAERAMYAPAPKVDTIQGLVSKYTDLDDKIANISYSFARHVSEPIFSDQFEHISGNIQISSYSGLSWFGKVKNLLPNVNLVFQEPDVFMGSIGNLQSANTVFVEEFEPDKITEKDLNTLSRCKRIFTCSDGDADAIREKLDDSVTVDTLCRIWPYVSPTNYVPAKNYIVIFNRSIKNTKLAINALKGSENQLVIVGARGKYPPKIRVTNEYIPYSGLIGLILGAQCVVDLPLYTEYQSAIVDLTISAGIPLISSNWFCMSQESDSVKFIVPSEETIKNSIQEVIANKNKKNMINYNDKFEDNMKQLFLESV